MPCNEQITKDTPISEAIAICPNAFEVFERHGMGCCSCLAASAETVAEGAEGHDVDVETILRELNEVCGD